MVKRTDKPVSSTPVSQDLNSLMEEYTSKLEQKIAYESQFFRLMADAMPQIVWTASPDGSFDYLNQRWHEYTGNPTNMDKGDLSIWRDITHEDDFPRSLAAWQISIKTGKPFEAEFRMREGATGKYRWFLGRALPGRGANGNILKWFGTCTDINDHKLAQEKKDEFIAIASHELKTPVTSIKAFAQLMQRRMNKIGLNELSEPLDKMETQIDKLTNLIKDLLDVSKIESGKLELNPEVFDFDECVYTTVENLQITSETHAVNIQGKTGAKVFADRNRVEQVLENLISNGIKYSPNANQIVVRLIKEDDTVRVEVKDHGIGIPPKDTRRVFERFYRAEVPKSDTYPGLGLGLYICAEIIRREHGQIWVESSGKNGSNFIFTLPITNKRQKRKSDA